MEYVDKPSPSYPNITKRLKAAHRALLRRNAAYLFLATVTIAFLLCNTTAGATAAPLKGFDVWYNHARSVNFVMVDEFDGLNEDLVEVYWRMEGKEMRRRVREVGRVQGVDVVRVEDGEMRVVDKRELQEDDEDDDEWLDSEASARTWVHGECSRTWWALPDMDFGVNAKAEGRVVVAWEALHSNSSVANNSSDTQPLPRHPDWRGASSRPCAQAVAVHLLQLRAAEMRRGTQVRHTRNAPCPPPIPHPAAATPACAQRGARVRLAFVGTGNARRTCKEPATRYMQGHFFSDWRTPPVLYPRLPRLVLSRLNNLIAYARTYSCSRSFSTPPAPLTFLRVFPFPRLDFLRSVAPCPSSSPPSSYPSTPPFHYPSCPPTPLVCPGPANATGLIPHLRTLILKRSLDYFEDVFPTQAYLNLIVAINLVCLPHLRSLSLSITCNGDDPCSHWHTPSTDLAPFVAAHPMITDLSLEGCGRAPIPNTIAESMTKLWSFAGSFEQCGIISAKDSNVERIILTFKRRVDATVGVVLCGTLTFDGNLTPTVLDILSIAEVVSNSYPQGPHFYAQMIYAVLQRTFHQQLFEWHPSSAYRPAQEPRQGVDAASVDLSSDPTKSLAFMRSV
ncbi:hypothetical protein C8J57DRAFT_1714153 [Mycena rebaudengoi]|nr:hypothetical protein C8J57DRAFT_1714153 [Mycena rebaudengoi]